MGVTTGYHFPPFLLYSLKNIKDLKLQILLILFALNFSKKLSINILVYKANTQSDHGQLSLMTDYFFLHTASSV